MKVNKTKKKSHNRVVFFGIAPGSGVEGGVGERCWLLKFCGFSNDLKYFNVFRSCLMFFEIVVHVSCNVLSFIAVS